MMQCGLGSPWMIAERCGIYVWWHIDLVGRLLLVGILLPLYNSPFLCTYLFLKFFYLHLCVQILHIQIWSGLDGCTSFMKEVANGLILVEFLTSTARRYPSSSSSPFGTKMGSPMIRWLLADHVDTDPSTMLIFATLSKGKWGKTLNIHV